MSYRVDLIIGATSWDFDLDDEGDVADGYTVLSGLNFGWSMPGGIWPVQPDAQGCSLTLNAPDFSVPTIENGDLVTALLSTGMHTPVLASFYGRVSDVKARTRPDRPGVFLDVIAVDLTVDVGERDPHDFVFTDAATNDLTLIEAVVDELGGDATAVLATNGIPPVDAWPPQGPTSTRDLLDQLLLQAVKLNDRRMIWAPLVGAGPTVPTLDPVFYHPDYALGDPFTIPAGAVSRDTQWSNVKGNSPDGVYTTGWGNVASNVAKSTSAGSSDIFAQVPVTVDQEADAIDVADFYVSLFDHWQIDRIPVNVTPREGFDGWDLPFGLFPDWAIAEGDPARSACYNAWIVVEDVDTTRTPDGLDVIAGVLTGAHLAINNGSILLELTIRRPAEATPTPTATFTIGSGEVASDLAGFVTRLNLADVTDVDWWNEVDGEADPAGCLRAYADNGTTTGEVPIDVTRLDSGAMTGEVFVKSDLLSTHDTVIELKAVPFATEYAPTDPFGQQAVWSDYEAVIVASADFADSLSTPFDRTGNTTPAFISGGVNPTITANGLTFGATASRGVAATGVGLGTAFTMGIRARQNVNDATHRAICSYGTNDTSDTKRATLLAAGNVSALYAEVVKTNSSAGGFGNWDWSVNVAQPITITRFRWLARIAGTYTVKFNGTTIGSATTLAADQNVDITLATPFTAAAGTLTIRMDQTPGVTIYFKSGSPAATAGPGNGAVTTMSGLRAPAAGSPSSNSGYGRLDFDIVGAGAAGHFYLTNSTDGSLDVATPLVATVLNAWHRWSVLHDGTSERALFVDGAQVAVDAGCAARPGSGSDTVFLGVEDTSVSNPWRGDLDYFYLRLAALSDNWLAAEGVSWETPSSFYTVT